MDNREPSRFKGFGVASWDGLLNALKITQAVCPIFPPLQAAVGALYTVLQNIQTAASNTNDIKELGDYVVKLNDMLQSSVPREMDACPKALQERIEALSRKLSIICQSLRKIGSRPFGIRILSADRTSGEIQGHIKDLTWAINNFIVGGTISIELAVDELQERVGAKLDVLTSHVTGIRHQISELAAHVQSPDSTFLPRYAITARFDHSKHRVSCEDNTRTETLASIYRWILSDVSHSGMTSPPVFWISGVAGSGKSTIAQTVAEWCHERKYLGASFFCSRDSAECSNVGLVFPTIARQLAQHNSEFNNRLVEVMTTDRDIQSAAVARQLKHLIVDPLKRSFHSGTCVIIIDALDECRDSEATSVILAALARYIAELEPLKFLITSRPVHNVSAGFRGTGLGASTQHLVLHEIPMESTERDIRIYLEKNLTRISAIYQITSPWPPTSAISLLVQKSDGLFIFAATAIKFIEDPSGGEDPDTRMRSVLLSETSEAASSPHRLLSTLYLQVLRTAFPEVPRSLRARLKMILGTLALSCERLSAASLEVLMSLPEKSTREALRQLHSVIIVPDSEYEPIRLIHPSFHDFLVDPLRCTDSNFSVRSTVQHTIIATRRLFTMKTLLRRDMCNINDLSKLNIEIPNLAERIQRHIPLPLQYACRHWAFHVSHSDINDELFEHLKDFCYKNMLHWLEVLSLLGELDNAIEALYVTLRMLVRHPLPQSDILILLEDCIRIVRQCLPGLRASCFQAYKGVVPFCPRQTLLRKLYYEQSPRAVEVLSGLDETWSPCVQVIEGHNDWVLDLAISAENGNVVSACRDHSIRVWSRTGAHLHTLDGHSDQVTSVLFYHPRGQILSASLDSSIRVWDMMTGACLHTRTVQAKVQALACSTDGHFVAVGCHDAHILIWDASKLDSDPVVLRGHRHQVNSIQFFHDCSHLVSGSHDRACKLWDIQTLQCQQTFPGRTEVMSVAAAPDNLTIACGLADNTISMWQAGVTSGSRILRGHESLVWSVDFSPDGTILASGSWDHSIRLWDVGTGAVLHTLMGHADQVRCLRFSADGTRIGTGSCDHSVRIWDLSAILSRPLTSAVKQKRNLSTLLKLRGHVLHKQSEPKWDARTGNYIDLTCAHHSAVVRALAFSANGTRLATGSWDGTIRLWNAVTGAHLGTSKSVGTLITSLSFSPDGKRIASSSYDGAVRLVDAKTVNCESVLTGHSGAAWKVVYAGQQLLSCSDDGSVRLWNVTARPSEGRVLLQKDRSAIYQIACSSTIEVVAIGSLDDIDPDSRCGYVTITLLNIRTQNILWTTNPAGSVESLSFSRDGSRLLSCFSSGLISLWGVTVATNGAKVEVALVSTFEAGNAIENVSFTPDERSILSDASYHRISQSLSPSGGGTNRSPAQRVGVHYLKDDWLWCGFPDPRRLCWVPVAFRHVRSRSKMYRGSMAVFNNVIAFGTERGTVVLLDASRCA